MLGPPQERGRLYSATEVAIQPGLRAGNVLAMAGRTGEPRLSRPERDERQSQPERRNNRYRVTAARAITSRAAA
ncbi:hypothetical protein GA0070613_4839 [Micromonospora inositola]|uniref:Uncharacterized protein n=1 Tax=Micromonospora inositola TaxID=47865 RepID=A0A1C5JK71_9ACTN|nr:hypothetical protein GA0070613_4839 [Micromonospora inositola]